MVIAFLYYHELAHWALVSVFFLRTWNAPRPRTGTSVNNLFLGSTPDGEWDATGIATSLGLGLLGLLDYTTVRNAVEAPSGSCREWDGRVCTCCR